MNDPFLHTLFELVDALDAAYRTALANLGTDTDMDALTTSQLRYVDAVDRLGDPTVGDVAEALGITPAAATVGIQRLVDRGYLTKARSPEDGRVFQVGLAAPGTRLVAARDAALRNFAEAVRPALDEEDVATFQRLVRTITDRARGFATASDGQNPPQRAPTS